MNVPHEAGSDAATGRRPAVGEPSRILALTRADTQQVLSLGRVLIALTAMFIIALEPADPTRWPALLWPTWLIYAAYVLGMHLRNLGAGPRGRWGAGVGWSRWDAWQARWGPWIDLVALSALLALGGGALLFTLLFFPVLAAAYQSGWRAGLYVAVAAAVAATGSGIALHAVHGEPGLAHPAAHALSLLVLGYAASYWGGYERQRDQGLSLLKEIGRLTNPRLGSDRSIGSSLEQLRAFYDAEQCLLITQGGEDGGAVLRRASRGAPERAFREEPITLVLATHLLAPPPTHALLRIPRRPALGRGPAWRALDAATGEPAQVPPAVAEALRDWFGPGSLASVPVLRCDRSLGRLYVSGARRRQGPGDLGFLLQVVECLVPLLDHVRLIDRMALTAAQEERQRLARDVHDGVIQPYVGIRLALSAFREMLTETAARREVALEKRKLLDGILGEVDALLDLTDSGIRDLRGFVAQVRERREGEGGWVAAASAFARRFSEITGIAVEVEADGELHGGDRMAAELLAIVAEGLSNVRRHTRARRVRVTLSRTREALRLTIANPGTPEGPPAPFTPGSISERARALGGWCEVQVLPDATTRVRVIIPV